MAVEALSRVRRIRRSSRDWAKWLTLLAWFGAALPLPAQLNNRIPAPLEGVGIDEKVGTVVDLGLEFTNEKGYQEPLRNYFKTGRPVLLNMVYYNCPMLCNLLLNGQTAVLREIPQVLGEQYEVVTISINPLETFDLARAKKEMYLAGLDKPGVGAHWHFLTDYADNAKKLASQIGFRYRWDARQQNYAHTAAIMFVSPEGKVCRYLYGIKFKPLDVRLALTEASQGKAALSVDRLLLFCYHYDPKANSYTAFATNFMRTGAALIVFCIVFFIWRMLRAEKAKRQLSKNGVAV
jgi:protein SCO1